MTRYSYAVVLSMPLDVIVPAFAQRLAESGLDGFLTGTRVRMEVCRVEIRVEPNSLEVHRLASAMSEWFQNRLFPPGHSGRKNVVDLTCDVQLVQVENLPTEIPYHGNSATPSIRCPDCGSAMHLRGNHGQRARSFYGCTRFPACKGTRPNQ